MLSVQQILNTPIASNCFVVYDKAVGTDCFIVDPGSEKNEGLYKFLAAEGLIPKYIVLTHEHFDHCWGVNDLRNHFLNAKLVCRASCSVAIQDKKKNYSVFYQQPGFDIKVADLIIENIDWQLEWNDSLIKFYMAEGHTTSGIIFRIDNYVFTGDELIKGVKTVTKLKTGSKEKLKESVKMLSDFNLENGDLMVCPGHGEMFLLKDYFSNFI